MLSPDTKRRVAALACFVLPVVLVKAAGLMIGISGPDGVLAGPQSAEQAPVAPAAAEMTKWSEVQLAAAARMNELKDQPFGPAPLLYAEVVEETVQPVVVEPEPVETPQTLDHIVLQVVMASRSSGGDTALINGRPYREGDVVRGCGWLVVSIDGENRSIVLEDPDTGRTLTKTVQTPR